MKALWHPKDTKAFCMFCQDHVFTFLVDIYCGDLMNVNQIYQDKGQAPWLHQERLICRTCGEGLSQKLMRYEEPEVIK